MTDQQIARIRRFIADIETQTTIKAILKEKFMGRKETDVHYLAAQTLATQFLEEAWTDMERHKTSVDEKEKKVNRGV